MDVCPKIMDVRAKNVFSCGPGDGEKLFDAWASVRKGQECPQEIWTEEFMFIQRKTTEVQQLKGKIVSLRIFWGYFNFRKPFYFLRLFQKSLWKYTSM